MSWMDDLPEDYFPRKLDRDFIPYEFPSNHRNNRAARSITNRWLYARARGLGSYAPVHVRQREAINFGYGGRNDYKYNNSPPGSKYRNTPHYKRMDADVYQKYYMAPYWRFNG